MTLEKEKNKLVLEKCQAILTNLLKDEDNKYCVDCDAKSPRWASWNIGIFLCIRCAGIHRNLGVHISKVKSVNLDTWTPQQVACIQQMGNSRARAVYEANLQDNFCRPQTDSSLEQFIRAKYEAKKYIAREWVPPPLPTPTWDLEIEKQLRKKREKKSVAGSIEFPAPIKSSSITTSNISPKPLPKAPGGRNSSPNQPKRSSGTTANSTRRNSLPNKEEKSNSGTIDLLGLDSPSTNGALESDGDIFGDFLSAAPIAAPASNQGSSEAAPKKEASDTDESSFFNQKLPESATEKMSKDSILALYSQTPSQPQPPPPVYGGSVYMGGGVPVMPPNAPVAGVMQAQQNVMLFQQVPGQPAGAGVAPPQYFPPQPIQGVPHMYPPGAMQPSMPSGVPSGLQLSAANPFAHMHNQMATMTLTSGMSLQAQGGVAAPLGAPLGARPFGNPTALPNQQQNTTLATNLWQ